MLSESVGFSKSGVEIKDKFPVDSLMENLFLSSPLLIDHMTVSSAVNIPAFNWFSSIE